MYVEWKDSFGFFYKEWKNEKGNYNREDGPAQIRHYPDGSINWEAFYLDGNILGFGKKGFWRLWDRSDEEGRQAPNLLKYLVRFL